MKTLIISIAFLSLLACQSFKMENGTVWSQDEMGNFTYQRLGIQFPGDFRDLRFAGTTVYDDRGHDVSIGYMGIEIPYVFTFYIYLKSLYPQKDLKSHFEAVVGDVFIMQGDAKLLGAHYLSFPFEETRVDGMIAFLQYASLIDPEGKSGGIAVLLPYGEHYIYMRMTYPYEDEEDFSDATDGAFGLMKDFAESLNIPAPVK